MATKNCEKQKVKRPKVKIENEGASAVKWPDFAASRKKLFGDRVLTIVDDLIKDRGRY